jgi:hypothetical protein
LITVYRKKIEKMNKKKESRDGDTKRMLEVYTMVPPFPGVAKKKSKQHNKKVSKISTKR